MLFLLSLVMYSRLFTQNLYHHVVFFFSSFPCSADDDQLPTDSARSTMYTGHFVVVCGYNSVTERYSIKDPARCDPNASEVDWKTFEASLSFFPFLSFFFFFSFPPLSLHTLQRLVLSPLKQAARRAFGTDEDLLLLRVAKHCACPL